MKIGLKRVYDAPEEGDGCRVLIDRVWPLGLSKKTARVDYWLKGIAPSTTLRKWFAHDPEKWGTFKKHYFNELRNNPEAVELMRGLVKQGKVMLVYGAKEERYNNAVALIQYLKR